MSKRFGRNQKRAMREEISALQMARQMDAGLLRNMRSDMACAEGALRRVEELLGPHTAALPPKRIKTDVEPQSDGSSYFTAYRQYQTARYWDSPPQDMRVLGTRVTRMCSVLSRLKEADRPDFGVHFFASFNGANAAYAASDEAIKSMRRADLAQHISESIAHHIVNQL